MSCSWWRGAIPQTDAIQDLPPEVVSLSIESFVAFKPLNTLATTEIHSEGLVSSLDICWVMNIDHIYGPVVRLRCALLF